MEWNLADLLERVTDAVPEREAVVCGARRLTFRALDERATRLANHLRAAGVGPGDHVGLLLYNGTEYLESMYAAFKLRAVPVNVNYRYVEEELRYVLDDADVSAIVFHQELAPRLEAVHPALPRLATLVGVEDGSDADLAPLGAVEYEAALAAAGAERDFPPRSSDDLYVLYTGGTTGMPKGVMWRHEDIYFAALGGGGTGTRPLDRPEDVAERARAGRTRCLPASPFMHGTAHWMAWATLLSGGSVVVSPDRHFDPVRLWELIAREQVSYLVVVGDAFARPLVEALDRLGPDVDVSSCRVLLSGGAVLSPAVKRALTDRLPGTLVVDGYGSSEGGGQGRSVTVAGSEVPEAPQFAIDDETAVLDPELRPVTPGSGTVGKVARRGHVPLRYHKDPVKTAATFPVVDGVRWAVTGDDALVEADGTITLLGRGSASINTGGEKVYPEEVEATLKGHPGVFDAVVVGLHDLRWGERVVALVQPRPGPAPSFEELDVHVRRRLAGYKAPRQIVFVDLVHRAPSGKPDYRWAQRTAAAHLGLEPV
ncbi:MAG: acyl-CoA synthetase [Acidimicrobiia bacterium]|nr:acyl-CoA synthetase [Acidimicrobiia bacterium]